MHRAQETKLRNFDNKELGLTDASPSEAFDGITRLARHMFGVPVSLISIVEEAKDRQFFCAQQGLPEPWASVRQTPLSHSFCRHVKSSDASLVVPDARCHPRVRDNPAIHDLGVVAYLGVPVRGPDGKPLGALSVIQPLPRGWTATDIGRMEDFALCVNNEIRLRAALRQIDGQRARPGKARTPEAVLLSKHLGPRPKTPLSGLNEPGAQWIRSNS